MLRITSILIGLLTFIPQSFGAAPVCGPSKIVKETIEKKFGETVFFNGVSAQQPIVVTIMMSKEKNTFTILVTGRDGLSCAVFAGKNWQTVTQKTY